MALPPLLAAVQAGSREPQGAELFLTHLAMGHSLCVRFGADEHRLHKKKRGPEARCVGLSVQRSSKLPCLDEARPRKLSQSHGIQKLFCSDCY